MPQIRYIDKRQPSPVRRFPRGVTMSIVEPSPYQHKGCRKLTKFYADGVIWCDHCGHQVKQDECINLKRLSIR
jgi:hypothetical protein